MMDNNNFFSGGPVHNILTKLKLEGESRSSLMRKFIFFLLITWLPLLILNLISSTAFNPALKISLLTDYVVWARFFIALAVLFLAERIIKLNTDISLVHFVESGIIAENNMSDYKSLLIKFNKIRDSKSAEVIILIAAYAAVLLYWRVTDKGNLTTTWIFNSSGNISLAGYWYYFVSAPIFQFFLYRMFWKFFLWAGFLFKVSGMKLNLDPTNEDLWAGLSFLGTTSISFGFIGMVQSCVLSAEIADRITINHTPLTDYEITIPACVLIYCFLFMFPMLFFVTKLIKVKFKGIKEYGVVVHKYIKTFDANLLKVTDPGKEQSPETPDSLSFDDSFENYVTSVKMKMIPFDLIKTIVLILIIAVPFVPLLVLVIPLSDIFKAIAEFFIYY